MTGAGSWLLWVRDRWSLTRPTLADQSGVGLTTIQGMEHEAIDPDAVTARRLANALCIYSERLRDGSGPMGPLWCMSVDDQHRSLSGPDTGILPGDVIVEPGLWIWDDVKNGPIKGAKEGNPNDG